MVEQALTPARALVARGTVRAVVFDTTSMTTVDADVRSVVFELLSVFRTAGVTAATAAVTSGAARMMGAAIAFGAGLPIEFFATFDEALARAKARAAKKR